MHIVHISVINYKQDLSRNTYTLMDVKMVGRNASCKSKCNHFFSIKKYNHSGVFSFTYDAIFPFKRYK